MQKEQIKEFTRRITGSNRSGLTLVTYDIYLAYLAEAEEAWEKEEWTVYKQALRGAQRALLELEGTLNFSYDLAGNLYQIYVYCRELLAVALYRRRLEEVHEAGRLMQILKTGFEKAAESDTSGPLMKNVEKVFAGYTYGRGDVVESCPDSEQKRGFLA